MPFRRNSSPPNSPILGFLALAALGGCQVAQSGPVIRVELVSRLVEAERPAVAAPSEGRAASGGVPGNDARFRFGARDTLWLAPGRIRVDTSSVEVASPASGGETPVERTVSSKITDLSRGEQWVSQGGRPYVRRTLGELDYERHNTRRVNYLEFVDAYVRLPDIRSLAHVRSYSGDLSIEEVRPVTGDTAELRIALEPGLSWTWNVTPLEYEQSAPWMRLQLVYHVAGLPYRLAMDLASALPGVPLGLRGRILPLTGTDRLWTQEVTALQRATEHDAADLFEVPERDRAAFREIDSRYADLDSVLAELEHPEDLPEGVGTFFLLLRLERVAGDPPEVRKILDLWQESEAEILQVELLRLALRLDRAAALKGLDRAFARRDLDRVLGACEALVAEGDPRSLEAICEVLRRRREFADVPESEIAFWAVRHLRVLSALELQTLADALSGFWTPVGAAERPDPDAVTTALAREVDYWLRWCEAAPRRR